MTQGLNRYQLNGDLHFITFSCFQLKPYLASPQARSRFEDSLERMRSSYKFCIMGYVVMPEHVHMLLSEPAHDPLFKAIHALKLSVSKLSRQHPFWQARYYDFNVFTARKHVEKLRYIHRNPVRRGLVQRPEDWQWSSFTHYAMGARGAVEIESFWTAAAREKARIAE
jgi:putative transposase